MAVNQVNSITLKEYAKRHNISYEAVRQSVKRYIKEINKDYEHIYKIGRTQYIDDYAVIFLDKKRKENPVVVYERNDEIEVLKDKILKQSEEIAELLKIKVEYVNVVKQLEYNQKENEAIKLENEKNKEELNKFKKTLFGLYKKVK